MAEISVIVPVYNVEKYLRRCVDSILAQSFPDFELILIDDGSPDRCGEICDDYAARDARIHVIHQQNGGLSAARNAGLDYVFAHSDSQWLTFIDSDDWIHPVYLEQLINAVNDMNCKIAVCDYYRTDATDSLPEISAVAPELFTPEELWLKNRITATVACCKLYEKSCFESLRFPVGKLHEDEYVTYQALFSCNNVAYIPMELYYYYSNPESITKKTWSPKRTDSLIALKNQCGFFRKNGFCQAERISAQELFDCSASAMNTLINEYSDRKGLIKKTRKMFRYVYKKYKHSLTIPESDKRYYERMAYPIKTRLKKKKKNFLIRIRRLFHA